MEEGSRQGADPDPGQEGSGQAGSGRERTPGLQRRRGLRERLRALRDYGPGSGSFDAFLRGGDGFRDRIGEGGERAAGSWRSIPEIGRQRILAGAIVLVAAALVWFVLLPLGPCSFPGGDGCAPADDAIELVPADALAYAHLSLDADDEQYERIAAVVARAPGLSAAALDPLAAGALGGADIGSIRDWAGDEAAIVSLPIGVRVQSAALLSISEEAAARTFAADLLGPKAASEVVDGVSVIVERGGRRALAAAFFAGFAVIGEREAVTAVVSRWTEQGPALATDTDAAEAIAALPERRVAYAYLSPAGSQELLEGDLRLLEELVDPAATSGVAMALVAEDDRLELTVRSRLDPELQAASPGLFAALTEFEPSLSSEVGSRALVYLGLGDLTAAFDSVGKRAGEAASQLPEDLERAARELESSVDVDLVREILPLLGSQIAFSVQPVGGAEEAPGVVGGAGAPFASLLAAGVNSEQAARTLAELQVPLAEAVSGDGPPQRFEPIQIAGVTAQTLPVSPAIDLTYATWADRLAISTDPLGIEQARSEGPGLDSTASFQGAVEGLPEHVELFAYANATEILGLAEQIGFATDLTYAALAPELRVLRSAALTVDSSAELISTDLHLLTSEE